MAKKVIIDDAGGGAPIEGVEINNVLAGNKPKKVKKLRAEDVVNEMMSDASAIKNAEKVNILIHSGSGKNGGDAVFVAVNGVGYLIPRDKASSVPLPILKALENAAEVQYFRAEDADGRAFGPILQRSVPRFAISRV